MPPVYNAGSIPMMPFMAMPFVMPVRLNAHESVSCTTQSPANVLLPPNRKWILAFNDAQLGASDLSLVVSMKIRGEEAKHTVSDKLYSSHKYNITQTFSGTTLPKLYPVLVARLSIIDPATQTEFLKNNKPIVKGTYEAAVTMGSGKTANSMQGTMKIQFTDCSYHHDRKYFAFRIAYFDPSKIHSGTAPVPLFTITSPPFRVYARKPTEHDATTKKKKKATRAPKKRKQDHVDSEAEPAVQEPAPKKIKTNPAPTITPPVVALPEIAIQPPAAPAQPSAYDLFVSKLDELVAIKEQLSEQDRKLANEWSMEQLLTVDPEFTMDFFLQDHVPITSQHPAPNFNVSHFFELPQQQQHDNLQHSSLLSDMIPGSNHE